MPKFHNGYVYDKYEHLQWSWHSYIFRTILSQDLNFIIMTPSDLLSKRLTSTSNICQELISFLEITLSLVYGNVIGPNNLGSITYIKKKPQTI